jgi:O-acetyl-ADP-ribose deacetylase (regulator of RNase III)
MENYTEVHGDLIKLAKEGEFDVIAHGCNCFCNMEKGIAVAMKNEFACNLFKLEHRDYKGDVNKMGQIDYEYQRGLYVVNAYTQFGFGNPKGDVDYEAFTLCMRKIASKFRGRHIGLPQIGAGLAKGDWERIKQIIQKELQNCKVTVVIYKHQ